MITIDERHQLRAWDADHGRTDITVQMVSPIHSVRMKIAGAVMRNYLCSSFVSLCSFLIIFSFVTIL